MRRPAKRVIKDLAEIHGLVHPDGRVNHNAFARRSGIRQATITRILNGPDEWHLRDATVKKLVDAFSITTAQARGDRSLLERIDINDWVLYAGRGRKKKPSKESQELVLKAVELTIHELGDLRAYGRLREAIEAAKRELEE